MRLLKHNPKKCETAHPAEKFNSLLSLRKALNTEHYGACPEIIRTASEYGATFSEINQVLAHYVRRDHSDASNLPDWMDAA